MHPEIKVWLKDIELSIKEIHEFLPHPHNITDTRNRIIHGNDSVSADVIWLIVIRYLPLLEKEVKELLK